MEHKEEKIEALRILCEKILPAHMAGFMPSIQSTLPATAVWRIDLDEIRGKEKHR